MNAVFISGAASGLGQALMEVFESKGHLVVAADIAFATVVDLRPERNLLLLPMDVSSPGSVENGVGTLRQLGVEIDILINNAGIFDLFPLSEHDPEHKVRIIQVNALGPVRLIRALLADLVARRGMVIQVSSESVRFPGAFQPYQISKIALEAYSRSVRQELAAKGVRVVIIRPGAMSTNLFGELDKYLNPVPGSIFSKEFRNFSMGTKRFVGRITSPRRVAGKVYRISQKKRTRLVYHINNNPVLAMVSMLPQRLTDYFIVRFLTGDE